MKEFWNWIGSCAIIFFIIFIADIIAEKINFKLGPERVSFSDVIWGVIGIAIIIILIKNVLKKIK